MGVSTLRWDRRTRVVGGGRWVVGGSPTRVFRLTDAGRRVAEAIDAPRPLPPGHEALTARFVDSGAAHPIEYDRMPFDATDVTVVVPAYGDLPETRDAAASPLVIVDDASPTPLRLPPDTAATLVRRDVNGGPAAARTTGAALARTPLVAFVDSDVQLAERWLEPLLAHFADDRVALVAPRVAAGDDGSTVAAYEADRSPLDLGRDPARIVPGTRVSYVPSAAVVVRAAALTAVGGFDQTMRLGEDVDLIWRLHDAGWTCRYEPTSTVTHRVRPTVAAMARQRYAYGTSAATLGRRHPGRLTPWRAGPTSAALCGALAVGRPLVAAAVGVVDAHRLARRLTPMPRRDAWRLAWRGHLDAALGLAHALRRAWAPLTLAALSSRRWRRIAAAAWLPVAASAVRPARRLDPIRWFALAVVDDLASAAGIWAGVIARRTVEPLRPRYRSSR